MTKLLKMSVQWTHRKWKEICLKSPSSKSYGVFFSIKKCAFILKNAISCFFLENVSPSKRVICFILNNLHFPMVKGIAFYDLYKSKVLIMPCKPDAFCLFIRLLDEIKKKSSGIVIQFWRYKFFTASWSNLKKTLHY